MFLESVEDAADVAGVPPDGLQEATYRLIEILLEESLMVAIGSADDMGRERHWCGTEASPSEVVAKIRLGEGKDKYRFWSYAAGFITTDLGAVLGVEAALIDSLGEPEDVAAPASVDTNWTAANPKPADLKPAKPKATRSFFDAAGVSAVLAQRHHVAGMRVGMADGGGAIGALFDELTANARVFTPGDRYLERMRLLSDGTVIGQRWRIAGGQLIDVRYPDRSFEQCVGLDEWTSAERRSEALQLLTAPAQPPVALRDQVLLRALADLVSLAEVDSILASQGVPIDDVPEAVFGLVRDLVANGLAMVGPLRAGKVYENLYGYKPWSMPTDEILERMRVELLVFGYDAWVWSAWFHLTEKGVARANQLVEELNA
jgi:hypothetical protein